MLRPTQREPEARRMRDSEDLDEVLGLADRIQALFRGRLSAPISADGADARMIGLMMAGSWEAAGHEA